jgi:hypothetical protein
MFAAMDDPIIQRIKRFRCSRSTLCAERRNRGYTLCDAQSGALVARLRPTGSWRTVLSIDDALPFIAHEDIFWVMTNCGKPSLEPDRKRYRNHIARRLNH